MNRDTHFAPSADDYASNAKGVALFALRMWDFHKRSHKPGDVDADFHSGAMRAYSAVLRQLTGRPVGTQRDMVESVISAM